MSTQLTTNEITSLITNLELRRDAKIKEIVLIENDLETLQDILYCMIREPLKECDSLIENRIA